MRRFRLSTLMLLIVIAALVVALVMERNRSARLEQQLSKRKTPKRRIVSFMKFAATPGGERPPAVEIPESKEEAKR
jgi:hypothetical protein